VLKASPIRSLEADLGPHPLTLDIPARNALGRRSICCSIAGPGHELSQMGEQIAKCYDGCGMSPPVCSVTMTDLRGIRHTAALTAASLFEAALLALQAFGSVGGWARGAATRLEVEVRTATIADRDSAIRVVPRLNWAPVISGPVHNACWGMRRASTTEVDDDSKFLACHHPQAVRMFDRFGVQR
jgi:hypothetical protein